jgi:hypothetical protein
VGFLLGLAMIGAPWLIREPRAWIWIAGVVVAALVAYPWPRVRNNTGMNWALSIVAMGLIVWPWFRAAHWRWAFVGLLLAASVTFPPRLLGAPTRRFIYAGLVAVTVAFAAMLFDGSLAWFDIGITAAADRYHWMAGLATGNLPAILGERYQWQPGETVFTLPATPLSDAVSVTMETTLVSAYAIAIALCAIGAAVHARRRDVRFLIAIAAPWVLFFALLPRMHERYLVWAAAITAVGAGVSLGTTLLHLLVTAVAFSQVIQPMLKRDHDLLPDTRAFVNGLFPEIGWLVLLLAAVYLFLSLAPSRRRPVKAILREPAAPEPLATGAPEIALPAAAPARA